MLLLCHCILNVNTRAPGIARWSNVIKPVWNIIRAKDLEFIQLPCLEAAYLGLRRWWFVKEQYSNAMFKDLCRKIGTGISEILLEEKIREIKLIGLGISPTCGYRETQSDPSWGGRPREVDIKNNIAEGPGILIEILDEILRENDFSCEIYDVPPAIIYPGERKGIKKYPRTFEESIRELSEFLNYDYRMIKLDEWERDVDSDIRSRKIFVCPYEALSENRELIEKNVRDGFGLITIPRSNHLTPIKEEIAKMFVLQIENHVEVGHHVTLYEYSRASLFFKRFREILENRNVLNKISIIS